MKLQLSTMLFIPKLQVIYNVDPVIFFWFSTKGLWIDLLYIKDVLIYLYLVNLSISLKVNHLR